MSTRVLFAGTPQTAVPSLNALIDAGIDVVGVLTRPDAPVGRKRVLTPSPVAARAEALGLPVIKASRLSGEDGLAALEQLRAWELDLAVVVAYGGLVPESGLNIPRLGWVNLHFSLLPAYRGAAPVQHAVIQGETITGASVFQLETGLDTGPVFSTLEHPIAPDASSGEVLAALADSGAALLARTTGEILAGGAVAGSQVGEPSFAPKLSLNDGAIDPTESAGAVAARINGTTPEPGAWALLGPDGSARIKFGAVSPAPHVSVDGLAPGALIREKRAVHLVCADGAVTLGQVQPAGKKMMNAVDWARGLADDARIEAGATG
ncbi:methionyl-tRNA formyltransferase [Citricoccus muralis]|uniref:Methionyl-tRNA formyltransferase n=1 Tax=Citricoccus muralis TaxID=169134 RepID=A0ABY8H292_9MICC|nr:methionyl-tRNA formyltransferase [Citricoccus muralis]WFP15248.1 methionyl-tRNA formyltransferase [Citricoccus muralis]